MAANALPALDERGLLPPGEYRCTLEDVRIRFGTSTSHRKRIWESFSRFLQQELMPRARGLDLVLGGSYLSAKEAPGDIDATIVVPLAFGPDAIYSVIIALGTRQARERIWEHYRVDFYVTIPECGNDLSAFFQYVGEKTAAMLNLQSKELRGVAVIELP
jgi:hypothetical protein